MPGKGLGLAVPGRRIAELGPQRVRQQGFRRRPPASARPGQRDRCRGSRGVLIVARRAGGTVDFLHPAGHTRQAGQGRKIAGGSPLQGSARTAPAAARSL